MGNSDDWLQARLDDWSARGLDTTGLKAQLAREGGNRSQTILRAEKLVERAEWLTKQIETLPVAWRQRDELLDACKDPLNVESVERVWRDLLRNRRPWQIVALKVASRWSREGRSEELRSWLERFDRIDPSMIPQSQTAMALLENAAKFEEIEAEITLLENQQTRRVAALEGMIDWLRNERGWALLSVKGNLSERYSEVSRIQDLDAILESIESISEEVISQFDKDVGTRLVERAKLAQKMEDEGRLSELLREGIQLADEYEERLDATSSWLNSLLGAGMLIDVRPPLEPHELLQWEGRKEELDDAKLRHDLALPRLDALLDLFPERSGEVAALHGQIEKIEQIVGKVDELSALRDEREQIARGRLDAWAAIGFETEPFELLLEQMPRLAWRAIEEHAERVAVCKQMLASIDALDLSYCGSLDAEKWRRCLLSAEVDGDDFKSVQVGVERRLRRNDRHRRKLDEERIQLGDTWPDSIQFDSLNLAEYEAVVTALQGGDEIHSIPARRSGSGKTTRLLEQTALELDVWSTQGWDVARLERLMHASPNELWLMMPQMRANMDRHSHLRTRMARLPLSRNDEILRRITSEIRRPEKLQELWDSLPSLAAELAFLPSSEGESFVLFEPDIPEPFTRLIPRLEMTPDSLEKKEKSEIENIIQTTEPEQNLPDEIEIVVPKPVPVAESGDAGWDELMGKLGGQPDGLNRDFRVQRLARLAMMLRPVDGELWGDFNIKSELIPRLSTIADKLNEWTDVRLCQRRAPTDGGLLAKSHRLALKLDEIPGPGIDLPRGHDDYLLTDDLDAITNEVRKLEKVSNLPHSGMKPVLATAE